MLMLASGVSWAQAPGAQGAAIYTCVDDQGRLLTRDRYIAECSHKAQRILNRDGSLRQTLPPTMTPDERAKREAEDRAKREALEAKNEAIRYDRLLLQRYPDKEAHDRARDSASEPLRRSIASAQARMQELARERKRLDDEGDFYRGRHLPPALRQQIESNEVAVGAQLTLIKNAQAEQARIDANYDAELERLRKLWNGAEPGSLGPPLQ